MTTTLSEPAAAALDIDLIVEALEERLKYCLRRVEHGAGEGAHELGRPLDLERLLRQADDVVLATERLDVGDDLLGQRQGLALVLARAG